MTSEMLADRFRGLTNISLPRPGAGATAERHKAIFASGREDLSLAKLIEAHWDAVAILSEANLQPVQGAAYAVWASEMPSEPLVLHTDKLSGTKHFCSGAPLVDAALVTAGPTLVEVDLRAASASAAITINEENWATEAFRLTRTATVEFHNCPVARVVGENDWYTQRPGFWQGACGPAAAWAGGAAGLLDYALRTMRDDEHALAHLGAMHANICAMKAVLRDAGDKFDASTGTDWMKEALAVRHTVEQLSTDVLRRFARSLGPAPFVRSPEANRRYTELDLFLRQCHAERDLSQLGRKFIEDRGAARQRRK